MTKFAIQISCATAVLILTIGCSNSDVADTWSGVNDLMIEDPDSGRSMGNTFRLNSNLILPKVDSDTSYTIESKCSVPVTDLENPEADKEIELLEKITRHNPEDHPYLKPLPIINYLDEMVFVYPELVTTCDFIFSVKTGVDSTDSKKILGAKFEYVKADHEIGINASRIDLAALQSSLLFESYSQLRAEYTGDLEIEEVIEPQADENGFVNGNAIEEAEPPKPLLKNAKIMCYTNEIKNTDLVINEDQKTFALNNPVTAFHSATANIPAENCVFIATDRNDKTLTSQTFDIVHNLRTYESNVRMTYDFVDFNVNRIQESYSTAESNRILKPLMTIHFENTSDEERLFKFDLAASTQNDNSYLIMGLNEEIARETINIDNTDRLGTRISHEMGLGNLTSTVGWEGEHLDKDTGMITIPEKEDATVTLYYETYADFSDEMGILVAPKLDNPVFKFSGISRNKFKETAIKQGNLKSFFFTDQTVSNLAGYIGTDHRYLLDESLFNLVFRNENINHRITFTSTVEVPRVSRPNDLPLNTNQAPN